MSNLLSNLETLISLISSKSQGTGYEPVKCYTAEEYVIYKQERTGERWHGVPLSDLSRLAQRTYRGKYVEVDKYNFLVFHFSSNSKKTQLSVQCDLDENGQLQRVRPNYYPGQWRDSADDFIKEANRLFDFR